MNSNFNYSESELDEDFTEKPDNIFNNSALSKQIAESIKHLNNTLLLINSELSNIQKKPRSKAVINELEDLIKFNDKFMKKIRESRMSGKQIHIDCNTYLEDVKNDLYSEQKKENYIYKTHKGMLSFPGRDKLKKKLDPSPLVETISNYININGIKLNIPIAKELKEMAPMFYNYRGDMYCCVVPGVYAKAPWPEILDITKETNRDNTVKCKYNTRDICSEQRKKLAFSHNSIMRKCNFAHEGERINKVGNSFRCHIPNIGNLNTIINDLSKINIYDAKHLLMYGLNDLAIAALWFHINKTKKVFSDLELA
jgi:hypothetical protein